MMSYSGVAALIGGGIYAYTKHKSKRAEEAKREVWQEVSDTLSHSTSPNIYGAEC
jgi:hypothetical protein